MFWIPEQICKPNTDMLSLELKCFAICIRIIYRHVSFLAAICINGCHNGGTCTAPSNCRCTSGWTGSNCQTGICHDSFAVNLPSQVKLLLVIYLCY